MIIAKDDIKISKNDNNIMLDKQIIHATKILQQSGLVAFPTETVYGLGANAEDSEAIKKVFAAKGRPSNHPLIVHIASIDKLNFWARDVSEDSLMLAKHFWPGPLTLILPKQEHVHLEITGGQDTVAVRVPQHPITLALLRNFNGLVGPSANKYGHVSPTQASHVMDDLKYQLDYVLDGGSCAIGYESTIVDCSSKDQDIRILRQGKIQARDIERVLGKPILKSAVDIGRVNSGYNGSSNVQTVIVPGSMPSHYAPSKPLLLVTESNIVSMLTALHKQNKTCAVLSCTAKPKEYSNSTNIYWHEISKQVEIFGQTLYAQLRELDKLEIDCMLVMKPLVNHNYKFEEHSLWSPILDRLERASFNGRKFMLENNLLNIDNISIN